MSGLATELADPTKAIAALNALVYLVHGAPLLSDKYYDLTGACSFAVATLLGYHQRTQRKQGKNSETRALIASGALLIWCVRLGAFLLARITRDGRDKRMDPIKRGGRLMFLFPWIMQTAWCSIVGLPTFLTNRYATDHPLDNIDLLGLGLWGSGFALEVVADRQKKAFAEAGLRATQGFITTGVWSLSRHPNYAGEIVLWLGLAIFGYNSTRRNPACPAPAAVFASPAFTYWLLNFVSGVPLLEKAAQKAWGAKPSYQHYVASTPMLWPRLF
jgi:steroid 5-alpha reductase family enzyme